MKFQRMKGLKQKEAKIQKIKSFLEKNYLKKENYIKEK